MSSSLLTIDNPKRITRGNQSLIRHTLADRNRNVLAPYVGDTVYVAGTVQISSTRNGRLFFCLVDVDLCSIEQSRLPHDDRTYIPIDHIWIEANKGQSVPPIGDHVANYSTVIEYSKLGGDISHGCLPLSSLGFQQALYCIAETIKARIAKANGSVSFTGITQSAFNSYLSDLKKGYFNFDGRKFFVVHGESSLKDVISVSQMILRKLLKYFKRGQVDRAYLIFEGITSRRNQAIEGFTLY